MEVRGYNRGAFKNKSNYQWITEESRTENSLNLLAQLDLFGGKFFGVKTTKFHDSITYQHQQSSTVFTNVP